MTELFLTLRFYAELAAAVAVYRLVAPRLNAGFHGLLLAAISLYFLWRLLPDPTFLVLAVGYAAGFAGLALLLRRLETRALRRVVFLVGLACAVAIMLGFKYPTYSAWLIGGHAFLASLSAIQWIGLSYMTFRALDLLILSTGKRLAGFGPMAVFAYLLFFPPFVAGPINRARPFLQDLLNRPSRLEPRDLRDHVLRICVGVIKIVVVGRFFYVNSIPLYADTLPTIGWGELTLRTYAYFLYFYIDFSGYCDVAISAAALFGIRVPENFNFPVLARNLQDFWSRWHISLSQWFRDYVFFSLTRFAAVRWPAVPPLLATTVSIFITFFLVGAWHGDSVEWVLYGTYHGAGLVVWVLYSSAMTALLGETSARLTSHPAYHALAVVLTFNFVAWGLILTLGTDAIGILAGRLFG